MAIPENILESIQEKADIVEVISRYISLKKAGRNFKANCPFHHEKTPSFVVSPDKQIYHCFGCGAGGNIFSFLMRYENIEFPEAVEMMAEKTGIKLPRISGRSDESTTLANSLYRINGEAAQFFQKCLKENPAARDYIAKRGINDDTLQLFKIGYAPDRWDGLLRFFAEKNTGSELLEKAGLIIPGNSGGYYDRFRNRIIFPISDLKDKILGFGARVLDSSLPKYINSPETPVYTKGRNLYGLGMTRDDIKKQNYALIVEGYLDLIIPYQAGIKNLIATLGTALTIDQVKLIKRFTNTIIMLYDPDEAGEAAAYRNTDLFLSEDMNVYVAELPTGYDPDSCIQKLGSEEFLRIVKSSKNLFDYKLDKLTGRFNPKSASGKANIAAGMLSAISKINNAVFKSGLIKKLSERLSVDEEALKIELKKVKSDAPHSAYVVKAVEIKKPKNTAEMMILALVLEGEPYLAKIKKSLSLSDIIDQSVRDIVKAVFDLAERNDKVTPSRIINYLDNKEEVNAVVSEAVSMQDALIDKEKVMIDCIYRIKSDNVKTMLERLGVLIKEAHTSSDTDRLKNLMTEYNKLVKGRKQ